MLIHMAFKKGFRLYIKEKEYIINTYRKHKNYDMVTFENINDINEIIDLKGNYVYIKREDIKEFIDEDLYSYNVIINNIEYKIINIVENKAHKIIVLENNVMIPYVESFIEKKDDKNKKIYMNVPNNLI